jgi:hypothetical protein
MKRKHKQHGFFAHIHTYKGWDSAISEGKDPNPVLVVLIRLSRARPYGSGSGSYLTKRPYTMIDEGQVNVIDLFLEREKMKTLLQVSNKSKIVLLSFDRREWETNMNVVYIFVELKLFTNFLLKGSTTLCKSLHLKRPN